MFDAVRRRDLVISVCFDLLYSIIHFSRIRSESAIESILELWSGVVLCKRSPLLAETSTLLQYVHVDVFVPPPASRAIVAATLLDAHVAQD